MLDLAAEAAVQEIMIEEEIEELDIPETLFEVVRVFGVPSKTLKGRVRVVTRVT